jgi:oxygen-dependent protoporphyrinogen oxidase
MLPLVSITGFFERDRRIKPGFGILLPPRERFWSLGVLYNHVIFPGRVAREDLRSETWILGGARRPEVSGLPMDQLLREFLGDRRRLHGSAGGNEVPLRYVLHRWARALPYYTVELEAILAEIGRRRLENGNLRLMGNYLGGIGLTKILDRVAEEVGNEIGKGAPS